jgi:hypothetical protein
MAKKVVLKLIDRSIVVGTMVEDKNDVVVIDKPMNIMQQLNPMTNEVVSAIVPMDFVFTDISENDNFVELKKEHIMWVKDLSSFPNFEKEFISKTTGLETSVSQNQIIT